MTIDEAIKQLNDFCIAFEDEDINNYMMQKYGDLGNVKKDYEATKVMLVEVERLKNKIEIYELTEKAYIENGERLEKENEQLLNQINFIKENLSKDVHKVFGDYYDNIRCENEQLREALKKCIPFEIGGYDVRMEECIFCGDNGAHTENCEYIRLTGGENK